MSDHTQAIRILRSLAATAVVGYAKELEAAADALDALRFGWPLDYPQCRGTAELAVKGVCPHHGGDACLVTWRGLRDTSCGFSVCGRRYTATV